MQLIFHKFQFFSIVILKTWSELEIIKLFQAQLSIQEREVVGSILRHTKDIKNGTSGYLAWRSAFIFKASTGLSSLKKITSTMGMQ